MADKKGEPAKRTEADDMDAHRIHETRMPTSRYTDEDLEKLDNAEAARRAHVRRLHAIEQTLERAGINLDDLIELIDARRNRIY